MGVCDPELDQYKATWLCFGGTILGAMLAPGWAKVAPLVLFVGCVYQHKAAARRLEDCLRAHGRISEADILQEHNERLAVELEYLESLGVQAA